MHAEKRLFFEALPGLNQKRLTNLYHPFRFGCFLFEVLFPFFFFGPSRQARWLPNKRFLSYLGSIPSTKVRRLILTRFFPRNADAHAHMDLCDLHRIILDSSNPGPRSLVIRGLKNVNASSLM